MVQMKIKTESLPERCEVCHQSDQFDATANHCERCLSQPETHPASRTTLTGVNRTDGLGVIISASPFAATVRPRELTLEDMARRIYELESQVMMLAEQENRRREAISRILCWIAGTILMIILTHALSVLFGH